MGHLRLHPTSYTQPSLSECPAPGEAAGRARGKGGTGPDGGRVHLFIAPNHLVIELNKHSRELSEKLTMKTQGRRFL